MEARVRRGELPGFLALLCLLAVGAGCGDGWEPVAGKDVKANILDAPTLHRDETHTVVLTLFSNGTETIPAGFQVELEVFEDADHTAPYCAPITVTHPTDIASCRTDEVVFDLPIDLATPVGTTLYLVATADSLDEIDEAIESNNTLQVSRTVAPERRASLTAELPFAPDIFRDEINAVMLGIRNDGDKTAPAGFELTLDVYEGTSPSDPLFAHVVVTCPADVLPGQTVWVEFPLDVNTSVAVGTDLYLVATIDTLGGVGEVEEFDETDNVAEASVQVLPKRMPDLIVTDIGLPAYMLSDEWDDLPYNVSVTVRNDDTDAVTAPFSVEVAEPIAGWSHTWLVDTGLAPGAEIVLSIAYVLASDAAEGDRIFTATADSTTAVVERDEGNNSLSETCRVEELDLRIESLADPPPDIYAGIPFNVQFRVSNVGTVPSPATDVVPYRVYYNGMYVDYADIQETRPAIQVPPLAPGASVTYNEAIVFSASSATGYCFILYVDFYHALHETDTMNNGFGFAYSPYP